MRPDRQRKRDRSRLEEDFFHSQSERKEAAQYILKEPQERSAITNKEAFARKAHSPLQVVPHRSGLISTEPVAIAQRLIRRTNGRKRLPGAVQPRTKHFEKRSSESDLERRETGAMSALPPNRKYHGEATPQDPQLLAVAPGQEIARCKACGQQFARKEGENPASAQFHRCEKCNKKATRDVILLYATCGASGICSIQ